MDPGGPDDPTDTDPPAVSGGAPNGTLPAGTTQATLAVTTDEAASCRYARSPGEDYAAMPNTFGTTGGTSHATEVGALQVGQNRFYVRCRDASGNANADDFLISFSVASGGGGPINGVLLADGVAQRVDFVRTPSISPQPNALLLLWVSQTSPTGTNVATATGNGLQWELIVTSVRSPPGPRRVSVLRAMSASPSAGPVTIDMGATVEDAMWAITQHTGVVTSGANGAEAVAQFATAAAVDFETSALVTLAKSVNTGSATIGGIFSGAAEPMLSGAGFLELSQNSIGTSTSGSFWLLVEFQDSFDRTVDASWPTPAHWVAIGIELQAPP